MKTQTISELASLLSLLQSKGVITYTDGDLHITLNPQPQERKVKDDGLTADEQIELYGREM